MAKENKNELALVSAGDLSLVDKNSLNGNQLKLILKKTPPQYVRSRPAKGGGQWAYVTGGYMKKCLNLMFGWDWDFEIIDEKILHDEVVVKGKLTCRSNGKTITKMQFGNKDIVYRKLAMGQNEKVPLSIGNDLKAAATDALKKCASEIGIAADIYNAEDFKEVNVDVVDELSLIELFEFKKESLTEMELNSAKRIIENKEQNSFKKLHELLISK